MVNIPSNLQKVWDDVSKDGKIDRADVEKLTKEAAPSLAASGEKNVDQVNKELDSDERSFLANFTNIREGSSVSVKNGTAKGTFDFIDTPPAEEKGKKEETPAKAATTEQSPKLFEPLTLPGSDNKTPAAKKEEAPAKETTTAPVSTEKKPEDTKTEEVKPAPSLSAVAKDIADIKALNELKQEASKDPKLADQIPTIDKKIKDIEAKFAADFTAEAGKIGSESSNEEFMQAKETLKKDYESLPEELRNKPEIKQVYDTGLAKTFTGAKAALYKEINAVIDTATQDALKTGDMSKFTEAKNKVEVLLGKYKELENDPDFIRIKGILSGDVPIDDVRTKAYNNVHKAIDTVTSANGLIKKTDWNDNDKQQAKSISAELPQGKLKESLDSRINGAPAPKDNSSNSSKPSGSSKSDPKTTTDKAISDVMGKGFFNTTNREGTAAIFQNLASKGELDETVRKMTADDQKRLIKLLAESNDQYSLAIAKRVYDNLSSSANISDDLDKKTREKMKNAPSVSAEDLKAGGKFKPDAETVATGLKYSVYSEKEAALTMARGIIDNTIPSQALNKLDDRETSMLLDIVGKNGSKEEKEQLLKIISSNYSQGAPVNLEFMNKNEKSQIIKNAISDSSPRLSKIIETAGKDATLNLVKTGNLSDEQLVTLAKHTDGDKMSDDTDVSSKMLAAMIKSYNKDPKNSNLTLSDITKFVNEIGKDRDKDEVMKKLIDQLGDGPNSEYAKFKALAPSTMDKIWNMAR